MSNFLDALKKPGQAGEPAGPPCLHSSLPPERKALKIGARRYLLAFALVLSACLLFWQLGIGQSGENADPKSEPVLKGKPLKVAEDTDAGSCSVPSGNADNPEGQRLPQVKRNLQSGPQASGASTNGNPAGQVPVAPKGTPSPQERKAATLVPASGPQPSSSLAENAGEMPSIPARRHSAARRAAMGEIYGRLPPQYFTRFNPPEDAANAGKSEVPKWPEPEEAVKSAALSARRAPEEKSADKPESGTAGQVVRFQDIPFRIRESIPISISMLSYSKRSGDSWVNLNGSKMHEGEQMDSGPKVETITPDGVIFSYQGHSFYKGVMDD